MSDNIRCFSKLANLRCTNLTPAEYIGAFVPHALGALLLPGLVWVGYKTRRTTILFLGLDIALHVILATWDLVFRLQPAPPLGTYRIEDIALSISSILPALFLLLSVTSLLLADLRPCLPGFCRSMISAQLYSILSIPLIPVTLILGGLGSFWGIQYSSASPGDGRIKMEFGNVYDDWLHVILSDAAAIAASVYLLFAVILAIVVVLYPQCAARWKLDLGPIHSLELVGGGMFVAAVEIIIGVVPDSFPLILARNILWLLSRGMMGVGYAWAYLCPLPASNIGHEATKENTQMSARTRPIRGRIGAPVPIPSFPSSLFDQSDLTRLTEHVRDPPDESLNGRTKVVNGREYSYRRAKKNIGSIYAPHRISVQECELSQWPPVSRGPHPHALLHPPHDHHPPARQSAVEAAMISPNPRPAAARTSSYLIPRSPTPPRPTQRSTGDISPLHAPVMPLAISPIATPDSSPGEIRTGEVQRFRTGNFTILSPSSERGTAGRVWPITQTSHDAVMGQTSPSLDSSPGQHSESPESNRRRRDTDPSLAIDPDAASCSSCLSCSSAAPVAPLRPPPRPKRSNARQPSTLTASSAYTDGSTDIPLFYTEPRQSSTSLVSPPPILDPDVRDSFSPAHSSLIRFPSAAPRYPSILPSSPHAAGCTTPPPASSEYPPLAVDHSKQAKARHPSDIQAVLNSLRRLQRDTGLQLEHARIQSFVSSNYLASSLTLEHLDDERKERLEGGMREIRDSLTTISEGSTPLASAGLNGGSNYRGGMI